VGTIVPGDRGRRGLTYTLLTPANRYVSRTPDLPGAQYYKLVTPRLAPSRLGEYLITGIQSPASADIPPGLEHFLLGMGGDVAVRLGDERVDLSYRGYLYVGPSQFFQIEFSPGSTLLWIKREWQQFKALAEPAPVSGHLADVPATATAVDGLMRRELLDPANPAFDFNISHMEFGPGVALAQIEIHDEEHGLYMTSGGGLYHLDGDEHPVEENDFIYMAPYCPQGFKAGPDGGSYLLYKDVYRDGF
jgi:(S)-ureidoglycine aminohydrolase